MRPTYLNHCKGMERFQVGTYQIRAQIISTEILNNAIFGVWVSAYLLLMVEN